MTIAVCCFAVFAAFFLMRLIDEIKKPLCQGNLGSDLMLAEIGRQRMDF
jgi:hypothetical protein